MATNCTNCGVQLHTIADACPQCGHPIEGMFEASIDCDSPIPVDPPPPTASPARTPRYEQTPDGPSESEQRDDGTGTHPGLPGTNPAGTSPVTPPPGPTSPITSPAGELPDDDSVRVERLLHDIAAQSHFEERYVLRGQLAQGGMGQVFRAFDHIMRREVAIKMMLARHAGGANPAVRGQFLKEARVGGRLLHPNILAVLDVGVNRANQIYYTMRLVDGASLQYSLDAVEKGVQTRLVSYPLRRVVEALVGACQGVDYAHQQGVIHLDLKPHNILVSGFSEVFVIDWGLARVDDTDDTERLADLYRSGSADHLTASNTAQVGGRVVGTPGYMAPEQGRGAVGSYGPTTDVYGLGGILHFILYGTAPNKGDNVGEMIHASTIPKKPGKLRPGILPRGQRVRQEAKAAVEALEAICLKALEPDQENRYPTAEAMIVELNEWLTTTPGPPAGF